VLTYMRALDAFTLAALLTGGTAIALVGFLDDHRPISATVRFGVHFASAIFVVAVLGGIPTAALARWGLHGVWAGWFVAVLTLVWSINLFNFMDGIDGIAASEAVFVTGSAAWLNWYEAGNSGLTVAMVCLAAATQGFLLWNWPRAKIFMGDVGSGFLGLTIAALGLAVSRQGALPIEVWGILGGVFLVDSTTTLLRRLVRGDRLFEAHRMHAYQHLARRWKSHVKVTLLVNLINLLWLLPWAWLAATNKDHALLCMAAALLPLVVMAHIVGAGSKEELDP
jgi:Fuc2NAc and GlcNAc transferase